MVTVCVAEAADWQNIEPAATVAESTLTARRVRCILVSDTLEWAYDMVLMAALILLWAARVVRSGRSYRLVDAAQLGN